MHRYATVLFIFTATILVGCDGWPPHSERHRSHFLDNQSAFEELNSKFLATDYRRASLYDGGNPQSVIFHTDVFDEDLAASRPKMIEEVDAGWTNLLIQTNIFDVERHNHKISFWPQPPFAELISDFLSRDRVMSIRYTYELEDAGEHWTCEPGYEELDCGHCNVRLVEDWSIQYSWAPDELAPDALSKYNKGEISKKIYEEYWRASWDQCQLAGAKVIGYEVTELNSP